MSVAATSWVFEHAEATANDRVVLLVLADHAHDDGTGAYPSQATIARKARISVRTVRDCLRRLEASGEIVRDGRRHGRTKQLIEYRIVIRRQDLPPSERRQPDARKAADPRSKGGSLTSERRQPSADEPLEEPSGEPSVQPSGSVGFAADAARLADLLEAKVNEIAETPGRKRVGKRWLEAIERLMRIDGRTAEQIQFVITWLGGSTEGGQFWGANVQSGPKLRAKFDQLVAKIKAERRNGNGRSVGRSSDDLRREAARLRSEGR